MLLAGLWGLAVFSPPHCSTDRSVICLVALTRSPERVSEGAATRPLQPQLSHHNSWSLLGVTLITSDYMPAWVRAQPSLRYFSFTHSLQGLRKLLRPHALKLFCLADVKTEWANAKWLAPKFAGSPPPWGGWNISQHHLAHHRTMGIRDGGWRRRGDMGGKKEGEREGKGRQKWSHKHWRLSVK